MANVKDMALPISPFKMSSYGLIISPMTVNFLTAGMGGMMGKNYHATPYNPSFSGTLIMFLPTWESQNIRLDCSSSFQYSMCANEFSFSCRC